MEVGKADFFKITSFFLEVTACELIYWIARGYTKALLVTPQTSKMEGFEATVNGQTSVPRFRLVLLLSLDHLFCSGLLCIFGSSPIVRIRELLTDLVWFYTWDWFNKPIAFIVWVSGAVDVFDHRTPTVLIVFFLRLFFLGLWGDCLSLFSVFLLLKLSLCVSLSLLSSLLKVLFV